jgi:protoporphyrin/coproporphyrin ferrochelatase
MALLYGDRVVVDFAMRYGNPSTPSVIARMKEQGCERIVFFPLYPQYSAPTTATANDQAFRSLMKMNWQPSIRTVPAYYDHPLYIDALARSVERAYAGLDRRPDVLVTSYHGVPRRYLMEGDPYHCQCQKTSRLLRERLGWEKGEIVVTFQSRFGPEEWLQPYTVEEVARLAEAAGSTSPSWRRPSRRTASRRSRRSTRRSRRASSTPAARASPTSPASTTTRPMST